MKYSLLSFILLLIICSAETCSKKETIQPISPIADFTYELGKNGKVTFKNTSTNAVSYKWDFGDSKTSFDENPIHSFLDEKDFLIKLSVESKDKIVNEISKKILIDNYEPIADFKFEVLKSGLVKITNLSKFASIYTWTIEDKNQQINNLEFEYTFTKNGKYPVSLNAKKTNNLSENVTKEITINDIQPSTNIEEFEITVNPIYGFQWRKITDTGYERQKSIFGFTSQTSANTGEINYFFDTAGDYKIQLYPDSKEFQLAVVRQVNDYYVTSNSKPYFIIRKKDSSNFFKIGDKNYNSLKISFSDNILGIFTSDWLNEIKELTSEKYGILTNNSFLKVGNNVIQLTK